MIGLRKSTLFIFLLIALPCGAYNGFVSYALGSLARSAGLSVGESARIIGLCALPFSVGNLLGPVADFGFSRRVWIVVTSLPGALLLGISLVIPIASHTTAFSFCVLLCGFLMIISQVAGGALITSLTPAHQKGNAAGWNQAGTMLGAMIGSAGTILIFRAFNPHVGVPLLIALFAVPGLAALALHEPQRDSGGPRVERLLRMRNELKDMFTDRDSLIGLLIFLSPVPSQAASNLFSSVAPDYNTGEHAVALITGIGGGLLSALGCAIAGLVCDRVDRRYAYVLGGVYLGACSIALFLVRPGPGSYMVLTSLYMIGSGYAIAASFALAFQIVGQGGGLTGGTRLGLYVGAVALAILYCTMAEGWTYDHVGRRGMFALDAGFNLIGGAAMTCFLWRFGVARTRSEASPA